MKDLKWIDAIIKVLQEEQRPMHYTEIAQLVAERGYRKSLGATPQDTVSALVSSDIKKNKSNAIFLRVFKGVYNINTQRKSEKKTSEDEEALDLVDLDSIDLDSIDFDSIDFDSIDFDDPELYKEKDSSKRIVNNFGIHWELVEWKTKPHLFGIQLQGATEVNFQSQIGIYLLHDSRETIYVGQAIKQSLGERLRQHTIDRLSGRWDRFSWFGFYPVKNDGTLDHEFKLPELKIEEMGDFIEALFIEALEPRLNRKQGNQFYTMEYLQKEDENIKKKREDQLLADLIARRR